MDWLLLDDKINKVMRKVAQLNGDEYHESFYNPHPYPGWCPELKHMMGLHQGTQGEGVCRCGNKSRFTNFV